MVVYERYYDVRFHELLILNSVPARLGKGQDAKEIGHNLAREKTKFGHNLVRKKFGRV